MYKDGRPLGWPESGEPREQGDYYCGVGCDNVVGREIVDRHTEACMNAEIGITGTNAEVALGQWEFQVLGKGVKAGDDLWMTRYILIKIAEWHGVSINLHPKPLGQTDWNGSGMHTNFSNNKMRDSGSEVLMEHMCEKLVCIPLPFQSVCPNGLGCKLIETPCHSAILIRIYRVIHKSSPALTPLPNT
jgi:glutamine synthetase